MTDIRRLFFGLEIKAPWPEELPKGRLVDPEHRHLTLCFLGDTDYRQMEQALLNFPEPEVPLGYAAIFDKSLFLPHRHPHVVAWHAHLFQREESLAHYQKILTNWLTKEGFNADSKHTFNPHVTLSRDPFDAEGWRKQFTPCPLIATALHLYQSHSHSRYESLWRYALVAPFHEMEHTADVAFLVRGEDFTQLFFHAAVALAFLFPAFTVYIPKQGHWDSLESIIVTLNQLVSEADAALGCPFKAVSYHSKLETNGKIMQWEMIIDV